MHLELHSHRNAYLNPQGRKDVGTKTTPALDSTLLCPCMTEDAHIMVPLSKLSRISAVYLL